MVLGPTLPCTLLLALLQSGLAACPPSTTGRDLVQQRKYNLTGQVHVLTGGDSGIGYGISLGLALASAQLVMLAHNVEKTQAVVHNITKLTGNDQISIIHIDLMSLDSVRAAAKSVLLQTSRVDAILSNAGLATKHVSRLTNDGFEGDVQLEYLGHFLLIEMLLPRLRESRGRVVHTSSSNLIQEIANQDPRLPFPACASLDRLATLVRRPAPRSNPWGNIYLGLYLKAFHAYEFTRREQARGSGVTAYSFHPGYVNTPGNSWLQIPEEVCAAEPWFNCLCRSKDSESSVHCPLTTEQGTVSGVYLAAAPASELTSIQGQLTVACGETVSTEISGSALDPRAYMVSSLSEAATLAYQSGIYDLSLKWIASSEAESMTSKSAVVM